MSPARRRHPVLSQRRPADHPYLNRGEAGLLAELGGVALAGEGLDLGHRVGDVVDVAGRHVVVGYRDRRRPPPEPAARELQAFESLRGLRAWMH